MSKRTSGAKHARTRAQSRASVATNNVLTTSPTRARSSRSRIAASSVIVFPLWPSPHSFRNSRGVFGVCDARRLPYARNVWLALSHARRSARDRVGGVRQGPPLVDVPHQHGRGGWQRVVSLRCPRYDAHRYGLR